MVRMHKDGPEYQGYRERVGERVEVSGYGKGKMVFYGPHKTRPGPRCGVVLDEPNGKNDGTVGGHTYFTCEMNHGLLCAPTKVVFLADVAHDYTSTGESGTEEEAFPWRMAAPAAAVSEGEEGAAAATSRVAEGGLAPVGAAASAEEEPGAGTPDDTASTGGDGAYISVASHRRETVAADSGSEDSGAEGPQHARERRPSVEQASFSFSFEEATTNTAL